MHNVGPQLLLCMMMLYASADCHNVWRVVTWVMWCTVAHGALDMLNRYNCNTKSYGHELLRVGLKKQSKVVWLSWKATTASQSLSVSCDGSASVLWQQMFSVVAEYLMGFVVLEHKCEIDEEWPRRRWAKSSINYSKTCILGCTTWLCNQLTNTSSYDSNNKPEY